ncbi:MAG: PHP domain-containing protein, partial [Candidatus Omnitrophota bacterium]
MNSKNNPDDVEMVFWKREEMVLQICDFVSTRVNWLPKDQNLIEIAKELNIGLDSLVFVDDSPREIELIRQTLPEVVALQFPSEAAEVKILIEKLYAIFNNGPVTDEDKRRSELYQLSNSRTRLKAQTASMEEYLQALDLRVIIRRGRENLTYAARIAQLTQRTNQFNLTGARFTEEQINGFIRLSGDEAVEIKQRVYSLEMIDKFGNAGLVAVMIVSRHPDDYFQGRPVYRCRIEGFYFSCRAIGLTLEDAFMAWVVKNLREENVYGLEGWYKRTERNSQVEKLYSRFGFQQIGDDRWEAYLPDFDMRFPAWIRVITPDAAGNEDDYHHGSTTDGGKNDSDHRKMEDAISRSWRQAARIGDLDAIRAMGVTDFADALGVRTLDAAVRVDFIEIKHEESLIAISDNTWKHIRKIRHDPEFMSGLEDPSIIRGVLAKAPADERDFQQACIYKALNRSLQGPGIYLVGGFNEFYIKSSFFHELLEFNIANAGCQDEMMVKIARHASIKVIEHEMRFACLMGDYELNRVVYDYWRCEQQRLDLRNQNNHLFVKRYRAQLHDLVSLAGHPMKQISAENRLPETILFKDESSRLWDQARAAVKKGNRIDFADGGILIGCCLKPGNLSAAIEPDRSEKFIPELCAPGKCPEWKDLKHTTRDILRKNLSIYARIRAQRIQPVMVANHIAGKDGVPILAIDKRNGRFIFSALHEGKLYVPLSLLKLLIEKDRNDEIQLLLDLADELIAHNDQAKQKDWERFCAFVVREWAMESIKKWYIPAEERLFGVTCIKLLQSAAYLRRSTEGLGRVDLHMHSVYSDGFFTPAHLVVEYWLKGFSVMSITDHDTFDSQPEAIAAADILGNIQYMPGIEMTVYTPDHKAESVHLLGHWRKGNNAFLSWLEEAREKGWLEGIETSRNKAREIAGRILAEYNRQCPKELRITDEDIRKVF